MKKSFLLVLLVAAIAIANAQQVQFGVKAGVNASTFSGSDAGDSKSIVGFHGGGLVNIPVSGDFSVQPELFYSGQGAKEGSSGDKLHLNYLNIPVLAKYTFDGGFFAETGPQLSLLLSAKLKSGGITTDEKDQFKSTDFAWALGVGYHTTSNLGFDVRYNFGIGKIYDGYSLKAYNSVFQFGVYYMFSGSAGGKK